MARGAIAARVRTIETMLALVGAAALILGAAACTEETSARQGPREAPPAAPATQPGQPQERVPSSSAPPSAVATPATAAVNTTRPAPPATSVTPAATEAHPGVVFAADFSGTALRGEAWVETRQGDFREAVVDILDGRLRLRAGTIGTRDDTVKHLGVRTVEQVIDLSRPVEVAAEIDWNDQANGCYLRASLFLCPTLTDGTAAAEPDWLKLEYVGVPPGKNGRALLGRRSRRQLRHLFTEGWPKEQRTGRKIGRQQVVLRLDSANIEIVENGRSIFGPAPHGLAFRRAYLYLQISSHSNYPPREIFFDNVAVRTISSDGGS